MARRGDVTPKTNWEPAFLAAISETGNVRYACEAAGISRQCAYHRRDGNKAFAAAWEDALEDAIERLELVARQRAMDQSDVLTIFLLKAHRPSVYRERISQEISGPEGGPIQLTEVVVEMPREEHDD